jgi:hypothetical protein
MKCHWLGVLILVSGGCSRSGDNVVPVSGQVYWNGQPLANAFVQFQPLGSQERPEPGPESIGRTDKEGKFTLHVVVWDKPGAMTGKHRVRISQFEDVQDQDDAGGPPILNALPPQFNTQTTLVFEVPLEGTDQAIFRLEMP